MPKITYPDPPECLFDAIVSECWAEEVAAGRGAEGQEFSGYSTFRVYSTLQQAIDDARQNIYVAEGEYDA